MSIKTLNHAGLTVAYQNPEYRMPELNDQTVCLTVTNGMLAPDVMVSATLTTSPGNIGGKVTEVIYRQADCT